MDQQVPTVWSEFKRHWREGQKKKACKGILCILLTITGVLAAIVALTLIICLPVSLNVLAKQDDTIQFQPLQNRQLAYYGIQSGEINGITHGEIQAEADGRLQSVATIVLSENVETVSRKEDITPSLSSGPDINDVYVHNNFTYMASITGESTGSFIVDITRKDKREGSTYHQYYQNITIENSSTVLINYSSDESGYYSVRYIVSNELNGQKAGFLSYNTISLEQLNNSKKCTLQSSTSECHISIEFQSSNFQKYYVLIFVRTTETNGVITTSVGRHLEFNSIMVAFFFFFTILIIACFIPIACVQKDPNFTQQEEDVSDGQALSGTTTCLSAHSHEEVSYVEYDEPIEARNAPS